MGKGKDRKMRKSMSDNLHWPSYAFGMLLLFPFSLSPFFPVHAARNDSAAVSTDTPEGRLSVFDDAWERINERYYDRKFHGLDWDAQRTTFRPLAAKAESSRELYTVLRRMIAPLNDPHTRVFAPEEKFDWWRPRFVTVGFTYQRSRGTADCYQSRSQLRASSSRLRAGDVIENVDGEAATSLIKQRLADLLRSRQRFFTFASFRETVGRIGWNFSPANLEKQRTES